MRLAATRLGAISQGRGLGNLLWDLAGAVPSLDQPFASTKSLVDAISGQNLITFSRTSDATVTDSTGTLITVPSGTPRFDHNPVTGESLGLLVEEQRANLLLRSEEFDNASWAKVATTVSANSVTSPSDTLTADKLVVGNGQAAGYVAQTVSFTSGVAYTISCYAKAGEASDLRFVSQNIAIPSANAIFNLSTGTVTSFSAAAASITSVGNGWYRCVAVFNATATASDAIQIRSAYTGDGTSGLYLWGAQLEAGAGPPTTYIPTAGTAVTRTASLADLISSAIANNIRSFYVEFRSPAVGTRGVVSLNDNTANERAAVITSGTDPRLTVHDGGVEQANIDGGTVTANARTRVAVRINANDFAISVNGGAVVTDTSGTLPTVDRLMFGRTQAGEYLNSTIARFTGWTQALPDGTLQALAQ